MKYHLSYGSGGQATKSLRSITEHRFPGTIKTSQTGRIPHFVGLDGLQVGVDAGLAGLVANPEGIERVGVAEVVGSQLEDRFGG